MTEGAEYYTYDKSFAATAVHTWNVSCTHGTYTDLETFDTADVDCSVVPDAVPEFNIFGIILILTIVGMATYYMRKK